MNEANGKKESPAKAIAKGKETRIGFESGVVDGQETEDHHADP